MKFKKGQRVRLSRLALARHVRKDPRHGIVVGFARYDGHPRVRWDGLKEPQVFHPDFLTPTRRGPESAR